MIRHLFLGYRGLSRPASVFSMMMMMNTDNICDIMFPYFYPAVMPQYCPSVCSSVTFRYRDHICWNTSKITSKIISPPNSDKIVVWRFLRNRRLLLCLHTIFRALIYWAHRAVVLAIAWHLVLVMRYKNLLFTYLLTY